MHSNIKVGTIVNIMKVNEDYVRKINSLEQKCDYCQQSGDTTGFYLTKIELDKTKNEYGEFLDFYI